MLAAAYSSQLRKTEVYSPSQPLSSSIQLSPPAWGLSTSSPSSSFQVPRQWAAAEFPEETTHSLSWSCHDSSTREVMGPVPS